MTDFKRIYRTQAAEYDQLVAREDYKGNILPALARIRPLAGLDVVELGAGTGRLTRLLAPYARRLVALDISPHMLGVAHRKLKSVNAVSLIVADNRRLPLATATADLALAGWSLGHFVAWYPNQWRRQIGQVLAEMKRVLRPGGHLILLETLGTGHENPQPPHAGLAAYYHWLENEQEFARDWIRTDYYFASLAEAERLTRFFFGDDPADAVRRDRRRHLPECTGLWWLVV